jgi:D-arabinose 1-dehydrogenase-like Zn-dependent alcohol dehydrogenase
MKTAVELFPLEQANKALRRLRDGRISGAAVLTV